MSEQTAEMARLFHLPPDLPALDGMDGTTLFLPVAPDEYRPDVWHGELYPLATVDDSGGE